jgi:hypothetical protein
MKQKAWDDLVTRAGEVLAAAKTQLDSDQHFVLVELGNLHRQLDDVVDEWQTAIDADATLLGRYRKAGCNVLLINLKQYRLTAKRRHVALEKQLLTPA